MVPSLPEEMYMHRRGLTLGEVPRCRGNLGYLVTEILREVGVIIARTIYISWCCGMGSYLSSCLRVGVVHPMRKNGRGLFL